MDRNFLNTALSVYGTSLRVEMVADMELQEAKNYVLQLMKDKDEIESKLKAFKEILDNNNIGMDEPLVDSEGYPRRDINVYEVRHARHKIICSRNDHKALMKKIEEGLHKVHALSGNQAESSNRAASDNVEQPVQLKPFLIVNLVSPGSPADIAGIQVNDFILKFGSIDHRNFGTLKDIGALVENSRYNKIAIKIKRGSNILTLNLTPRPWAGNGLLGCNVNTIEI